MSLYFAVVLFAAYSACLRAWALLQAYLRPREFFREETEGPAGSIVMGPCCPSSGVDRLGMSEFKHTTARLLLGIADTELISMESMCNRPLGCLCLCLSPCYDQRHKYSVSLHPATPAFLPPSLSLAGILQHPLCFSIKAEKG